MKKMLVAITMNVILVMSILGCGTQKAPDDKLKYERAKQEAENKSAELLEILRPLKAIERGDTSLLSSDPETLKRISDKMNKQTIQKLSNEVNQAMKRVAELKPEGYSEDYELWVKKVKEKLDSVK
jgi:hypothetical protein